ncbi:hypothetical protein [Bifidobacterium sp. ESL0790]|uniref:hypothetical protein n=1 Tax=Bifidobacterium sp. ESL0790 TaxID=2983233 RepID=UPI0023F73B33|nr:hypothetical protein [Bifidobacterium sp. ESL0790]WEV72120.1 hypothetical protein OZY47_06685 [Bifidobacterium sp. ESL0790]
MMGMAMALLAASMVALMAWMCVVPACMAPLRHLIGFLWVAFACPGLFIAGMESLARKSR